MKTLYLFVSLLIALQGICQKKDSKTDETGKPFVLHSIEELPSAILGETRVLNIYLGKVPLFYFLVHWCIIHPLMFRAKY